METCTLSPPSYLWYFSEIYFPSSYPYWTVKTFSKENKCHAMHHLIYRKMTIFPKVTTVYTTNLQPVHILHLYFAFYKCNFHLQLHLNHHFCMHLDKNTLDIPHHIQAVTSQNHPLHPDNIK